MHKYKCASCGHIFTTENFAEKCPKCDSNILIHKVGEPKKGRSCGCSGGNCSSCSSSCR